MPPLDLSFPQSTPKAVPPSGDASSAPRPTRKAGPPASTSAARSDKTSKPSKGGTKADPKADRDGFGQLVARLAESGEDDRGAAPASTANTTSRDRTHAASKARDEGADTAKRDASAAQDAVVVDPQPVVASIIPMTTPFPWTLPLNSALWGDATSEEEKSSDGESPAIESTSSSSSAIDAAQAAANAANAAQAEMVNVLVSQTIAATAPAQTAVPTTDATTDATAVSTSASAKIDATTNGVAAEAASTSPSIADDEQPLTTDAALNAWLAQQQSQIAPDTKTQTTAADQAPQVKAEPTKTQPAPTAFASMVAQADASAGDGIAMSAVTVDPQASHENDATTDAAVSTTVDAERPSPNPRPQLLGPSDHPRRQAMHELLRAIGDTGSAPIAPQSSNGTTANEGAIDTEAAAPQDAPASAPIATAIVAAAHDVTARTSAKEANAHVAVENANAPAQNAAPFSTTSASTSTSEQHGQSKGFGRDTFSSSTSGPQLNADSSVGSAQSMIDFRALTTALAGAGHQETPIAATTTAASLVDTNASADDQAAQIVRGMKLQWRGSTGEATLRLQPEHLGQVLVNVRVEQGTVSATVHAETAGAQQWIQAHQQQLRDALDAQGLRVAQFHVTSNPEDRPRRDQQQTPEKNTPRARAKRTDSDRTFEIRI